MKNLKQSIYFISMMSLLFIFSCKHDVVDPSASLQQVVDNMGGVDLINGIKTITYSTSGNCYEYEQSIPSLGNPLTSNSYTYKYSTELNTRKIRIDYDFLHLNQPTYYDSEGPLVIINNKQGSISEHTSWRAYYFGTTTPRSLFASEIEAYLKNQKMANPLEMLKEIMEKHNLEQSLKNNTFSLATRIDGLNLELTFDSKTLLPASSKTTEVDFLQGDVIFEVFYKGWIDVAGTKYPTIIDYTLNGNSIKLETLSDIVLNPSLDPDTFEVVSIPNPFVYDDAKGDLGIYHAQFYHRWNAWNIPFPYDVNSALDLGNIDLSIFGQDPQYISENIKIIGRPDNRLWSVAINTTDGIVLVDAPLNQIWTRSIIDAAKTAFPGKEVISVVSTHIHHEHFAGIREAAYETGKVYIAKEGVDFLNQVLNTSHELSPDNLANRPREVQHEIVSNVTYLDNGAVEIHKVALSDNSFPQHSDGILVVYIPEDKLIIQSDLLWSGDFMDIWRGEGLRNYTPESQVNLRSNAKYLLNYIEERQLDVNQIASMHGGLGSIDDLILVANN